MRYMSESNLRKRLKAQITEDIGDKMSPTAEWMQEKYNQLNQELFNGELGNCLLVPSSLGKHTLGMFSLRGNHVVYNSNVRRLRYQYNCVTLINHNNFADIAKPCIELNSNFIATEKSLMSTLLHEMCHYYTYMNGNVPKQAHGKEFRAIAAMVSAKSRGVFPVETLASAEEMQQVGLSDSAIDNINKSISRNGGAYLLTMELDGSSYMYGYTRIVSKKSLKEWEFRIISAYPDIIFRLYNCNNTEKWYGLPRKTVGGYRKTNNIESLLQECGATLIKTYNDKNIIPIFRINFSNGNSFELKNCTKEQIKNALEERYPQWGNEIIQKQMDNPKNYPQNESVIINGIVENIMNKLISQSPTNEDGLIKITPDMNLGLESLP